MIKKAPARISVSHTALVPWGKIYPKLRQDIEGIDESDRPYGGEISDAEIFHMMVLIFAEASGLGERQRQDKHMIQELVQRVNALEAMLLPVGIDPDD